MRKNRFHKSERGQSLTELAVSFTLLVIILAVAVDLGRIFFSFIAIREAAEEGALYGSLGDFAGVEQRVRTSSTGSVDLQDTTLVSVTIVPIGGTCADGDNALRVTVTYTYNLTMPLVGAFVSNQSFPLTAVATSTILRPEC